MESFNVAQFLVAVVAAAVVFWLLGRASNERRLKRLGARCLRLKRRARKCRDERDLIYERYAQRIVEDEQREVSGTHRRLAS